MRHLLEKVWTISSRCQMFDCFNERAFSLNSSSFSTEIRGDDEKLDRHETVVTTVAMNCIFNRKSRSDHLWTYISISIEIPVQLLID